MQNKNIKIVGMNNKQLSIIISLIDSKIKSMQGQKAKLNRDLNKLDITLLLSAKCIQLCLDIAILNIKIDDMKKLKEYFEVYYEKE